MAYKLDFKTKPCFVSFLKEYLHGLFYDYPRNKCYSTWSEIGLLSTTPLLVGKANPQYTETATKYYFLFRNHTKL